MMLVGNNETPVGQAIARWHAAQTKRPVEAPYGAMAWCNAADEIENSAIFSNYNGSNIDIHLFLKRPHRKIRSDIYWYVFQYLKCKRLSGKIPAKHTRLIRLAEGLGFHLEGSLPHFYAESEVALAYGLYADDPDVRKMMTEFSQGGTC